MILAYGLFPAKKMTAYQKHDISQLLKLMFPEFISYNDLVLLEFQLLHFPSIFLLKKLFSNVANLLFEV